MKQVPDITETAKNPYGSTWTIIDPESNGNVFFYNMRTGKGLCTGDITGTAAGDIFTIKINRESVRGFNIVHNWTGVDVETADYIYNTEINSVFPNPFTKTTDIKFSLNKQSRVRIEIIDELGKLVNVLKDADFGSGQYDLNWSGNDMNGHELPSGNYTCRMVAGSVTSTQRVVIIR